MSEPVMVIRDVLRVDREGLVFFKGAFLSDVAKDITQVHVFEESKKNHVVEVSKLDGEEGYQRPALLSRQNKFAQYLAERPESETHAPPVVLNARGKWRFRPYDGTPNFGSLELKARANIIDGQHRLGGYIAHFKDGEKDGNVIPRHVDFMAYESLNAGEEKWVFHTINTNQKGVPPALSTIIDDRKWMNRVARKIAEDASSPFAGKVSMAGQPGPQYLWKLNAVAKNVERMFKGGEFDNTPEESKYDMFVRYWELIRDTHSEAWEDFEKAPRERTHKLLELTGLIAYSRLFNDRFRQRYDAKSDTLNWDYVRLALDELAGRLDLRKKVDEGDPEGTARFQGMTGEYGAGQILLVMQQILAQFGGAEL